MRWTVKKTSEEEEELLSHDEEEITSWAWLHAAGVVSLSRSKRTELAAASSETPIAIRLARRTSAASSRSR